MSCENPRRTITQIDLLWPVCVFSISLSVIEKKIRAQINCEAKKKRRAYKKVSQEQWGGNVCVCVCQSVDNGPWKSHILQIVSVNMLAKTISLKTVRWISTEWKIMVAGEKKLYCYGCWIVWSGERVSRCNFLPALFFARTYQTPTTEIRFGCEIKWSSIVFGFIFRSFNPHWLLSCWFH